MDRFAAHPRPAGAVPTIEPLAVAPRHGTLTAMVATRGTTPGGSRTARRRAVAATVAAVAIVAIAMLAPRAHAVTFGSDLSRPANLAFSCEQRPSQGAAGAFLIATGAQTCTWWPAPLTAAATYVPVGEGRITAIRVRAGTNPAPLRVTILSSGGGLCCTSRSQSAVFQPTPNAVTSVPVDLPAGAGLDPNRPGSQYNDIVAISAVGPGTLPVHDLGAHGTFNTSVPAASFLHPELPVGASNTDAGWMDGYEVLLQADWCGTTGIPPRQASTAQACPTTPPTQQSPPSTPPAQQPPPQTPPVQPPPTTPPAAAQLSALRLAGRGRALTLRVSAPATVTARLARCRVVRRPRRRTVCRTAATLRAAASKPGALTLRIPRRVRAGRYRVTVTAGEQRIVRSLEVKPAGTRAEHRAGRR
jgi:hypothetical protein